MIDSLARLYIDQKCWSLEWMNFTFQTPPIYLPIPIFWLDKVGHCLWFLIGVMMMSMWVIRGSNVFQLVDTTTFITSFERSFARDLRTKMSAWEWTEKQKNIPQPIGHGGNQLEIQYSHIEVLHQHHEQQLGLRKYLKRGISSLLTSRIAIDIPTRSDGSGLISKISTPCIFPRISRRSRPVACSKSVGIVPGAAPGGRRSSSVLISVVSLVFLLPTYDPAIAGRMSLHTFECLQCSLFTWLWIPFRGLLLITTYE